MVFFHNFAFCILHSAFFSGPSGTPVPTMYHTMNLCRPWIPPPQAVPSETAKQYRALIGKGMNPSTASGPPPFRQGRLIHQIFIIIADVKLYRNSVYAQGKISCLQPPLPKGRGTTSVVEGYEASTFRGGGTTCRDGGVQHIIQFIFRKPFTVFYHNFAFCILHFAFFIGPSGTSNARVRANIRYIALQNFTEILFEVCCNLFFVAGPYRYNIFPLCLDRKFI